AERVLHHAGGASADDTPDRRARAPRASASPKAGRGWIPAGQGARPVREATMTEPVPFEVYEDGVYLHGTRAGLQPGDRLTPSQPSNSREEALRHVYVTSTRHAAAWGAQLAKGEGEPRVYVVEPTGPLEDDPNVTDQRFPGNPTRSYRTLE